MKISQLLKKLEESKTYKDFSKAKETKDSFFCAGFIILNFKQNLSDSSIDFRNDKQIFTFKIPEEGEVVLMKEDIIEGRKPLEKIEVNELKKLKTDIEDLQKIVQAELDKNKVQNKLDEIIAVLQNHEGKLVWNLTCMCEGFAIINCSVDALSGKVLKFEKKNLLDFLSVKNMKDLKKK